MTRLLPALAAVILSGAPVATDAGQIPRSLRAIPTPAPPANEGGVAGPGTYFTGFEPDEGFTLGYIGSNGLPPAGPWGALAASAEQPQVDNVNPSSGEQHLRLSKDTSIGLTFVGGFSPNLGAIAGGPVTFAIDVSISATGGASYDVLLQSPSQGTLAARVRFDPLGNILIFDNPGSFLQFVDSGTDWTPGVYQRFSICLDPDLDSLEYYLDGELFYTSQDGVIAADSIEQVIIAAINDQDTDHGDFDNIEITDGLNCEETSAVADECEDCIAVTEGSFEGSTLNNTGSTGDDTSCSLNDTIDQWFCYTASCTGLATASTCDAADFDTTIAAFADCDGSNIACNDDGLDCGGFTSELVWPVEEGVTYYLRVAGFQGETGDYTLSISCDPDGSGPENDDCADADPIGDGSTPFDTTGATTDGPAHDACINFGDDQVNQDIWYDYVASCTGLLTLSTCNAADFDTRLAAYNGTDCPVTEKRLLGCNDDGVDCVGFTSRLTVPVVSGQSYKIRVGGFGSETGAGDLAISCAPTGGPDNNSCADALVITEGVTPFSTLGATTDGLPSTCPAFVFGDDQVHNDVWYTYTATCTGELSVSTCGTADFDTRLAVYLGTGCPAQNNTLVACNDDSAGCAGFTSELIVTVLEGQQYTIRVGGFSSLDSGSGTLAIGYAPTLILRTVDDPDGYGVGDTVPVELYMEGLCGHLAAGFQAFIEFDTDTLAFASGLYTPDPFGLHILAPISANGALIDLAAGINQFDGQLPTADDSLLATLQFTALADLCNADVQFRDNDPPTRITDADGIELLPLITVGGVTCPGDVNGDGQVNVDDLVRVILAWENYDCNADVNDDGDVDVDDLVAVVLLWGPCPG